MIGNDFYQHKKLVMHSFLWGALTLIFFLISYNFFSKSIELYIYNYFGYGVSYKISNIVSAIFSPKIWVLVTVLSLVLSIYSYKSGFKKQAQIFILIFLSEMVSMLVVVMLKVCLARPRPALLIEHDIYALHYFSFNDLYNSFPSGHMAQSACGLLAIREFKPSILKLKYIISILIAIGLARIFMYDHYIGDVLCGLYVGVFSFFWVKYFLYRFAGQHTSNCNQGR
ncbi:phosphatase PAP2 family protein [Francisellaceae bacterium]|nr:phosphatase PAP2 family protein [Francisellaceae bacterium]